MLRIIILCICTALVTSVYAQQDGEKWEMSQELELIKGTYFKVFGKWKGDYKMARIADNYVELLSFRDDLTIRWGRMLSLVQKEPIVHEVIGADERIFVLYSIEQEDSLQLVLARYEHNGNPRSSMIVKNIPKELGRPAYEPILSENNEWLSLSYLGIDGLYEVVVISLKNMLKIREDVYDFASFELEGKYPYQYVTDYGTVFIGVDFFEVRDNTPNQFMTFLQVFPDDRDTEIKELSFKNYIVENPLFHFDNEDSLLYLMGILRDFRIPAGMGIYMKAIPIDFETDSEATAIMLDKSIVDVYNKKLRNPLPGIPGLRMADIHREDDGQFTIMTEVRFDIFTSAGTSSMRGGNDMEHYYDEVVIMRLDKNGDVIYQQLLEKEQYSINDGAVKSSFFTMKKGNDYHLIFNDQVRNRANVKEFIIRPDGTTSEETLFSTRRMRRDIYISSAVKISEEEFVVPGKRRRSANLIRYRF